ncbi:unnamed protein product, partial [Brassica oleracea var. botrytis]
SPTKKALKNLLSTQVHKEAIYKGRHQCVLIRSNMGAGKDLERRHNKSLQQTTFRILYIGMSPLVKFHEILSMVEPWFCVHTSLIVVYVLPK